MMEKPIGENPVDNRVHNNAHNHPLEICGAADLEFHFFTLAPAAIACFLSLTI
jgi:hypothetical protein